MCIILEEAERQMTTYPAGVPIMRPQLLLRAFPKLLQRQAIS